MGDPAHAHDEDRIRQAAELGGATDVIQELPDGFDTFLDKPVRDYYSGVPTRRRMGSIALSSGSTDFSKIKRKVGKNHKIELSGGQMQKLAVYVPRYHPS